MNEQGERLRKLMLALTTDPAHGLGRPLPSAYYAQKTITFHLEFRSEIVERARYERLILYSLEHLKLADKALGRIKGD